MFPLIAYTALLLAAVMLSVAAWTWLFVIGGVAVLLLFIGIHNAWDAVTYIALQAGRERPEGSPRG